MRYYCGAILLDLRVGTLLEEEEEEEEDWRYRPYNSANVLHCDAVFVYLTKRLNETAERLVNKNIHNC